MRRPTALMLAAMAMAGTSVSSPALGSAWQSPPATKEGAFSRFAPEAQTSRTQLD